MHYFKFDYNAIANPKSVILGEKFRFTIIFDRLFRLEHQEQGIFEDRPSQSFLHRNQETPEFHSYKIDNYLFIKTKYWTIKYLENTDFSKSTLQITHNLTGYTWYPSKPTSNLYGTARTLDNCDGPLPLENGIFSKDNCALIDDSNTLVYEGFDLVTRNIKSKDFYFFGYDSYEDGLRDFYAITGKTPLIPKYVLGNWWSKYWNYTDNELQSVVDNFSTNEIPLSVCIIDMDWHLVNIDPKYGSGWTGYTWNNDNFKNPEDFIKNLHNKNIKVSLNLHPADGVRAHELAYLDFANYLGIDPTTEESIKFDSTSNKFMEGYFKYLHHPLEKMGVDFWWIDWQQGNTSSIYGLDPLWQLNHMHFIDKSKKSRGLIFSRWAGIGSHRYPIGFSGDTVVSWKSLKFQVYFTLTASNIGFGWWSHDVGGHFFGHEESELYVRWLQFSTFSPVLRLHSSNSLFYKREPWSWDKNTLYIAKKYMQFRHQIIPYIYSFAHINSQGGLPLIRPLYYHHKNAFDSKDTYYFGSELIISPYVDKMKTKLNHSKKTIYLPKGEYFDYFTNTYYQGNKNYTLYGKLDETPIFAKKGAIIVKDPSMNAHYTNSEKLEIDLFLGDSNEFKLYEDDGVTNSKLSHETIIKTSYTNNSLLVNVTKKGDMNIIPNSRIYEFIIHSVTNNVTINTNQNYKMDYDYELNNLKLSFTVDSLEDNFSFTISASNDLLIKTYNSDRLITNLLLESSYPTKIKHMIGYVYEKYNKAKTGIISENISSKEKINKINALDIPKTLKEACINLINNELKSLT